MINLAPDKILDERYRIISTLGEGGMGSVYKAEEIGLQRVVALKILQPGLAGDEEQRKRFEREGQALSSLSHKNLIMFYRLGIWQNLYPYIAMEFLSGKSLLEVIQQTGPLKPRHALELMIQVCEGMEHAHRAGIIHRDLKPGNLMLVDKEVGLLKVVDFGLARMDGSATKQGLTQTGALIGSVHYMSPEQCTGRKADARSDVYAVGCILFEVLTGSPPFTADNPVGLLHLHASEPVPPIALPGGESKPQGLDAVIQKALCKDVDQRYQTMREMQEDIELVLGGKGGQITVEPTRLSTAPSQLLSKKMTIVAIVAAAAIGTVATLAAMNSAADSNKLVMQKRTSHTKKGVSIRTELHQIHKEVERDDITEKELKEAQARVEENLARIPQDNPAFKMQAYILGSSICDRLIYRDKQNSRKWRTRAIALANQALACVQGRNLLCEATVLSRLGELYSNGQDFKQAKTLFLAALAIAKERLPSTQFVLDSELPGGQRLNETLALSSSIAICERQLKDYKSAEHRLVSSIEEANKERPEMRSETMNSIDILLDVYDEQGQQEKIEELVRRTTAQIDRNLDQGLIKDTAAASFYATLSFAPTRSSDMKDSTRLCTLAVNHLDASCESTTLFTVSQAVTYALRQARERHSEEAQNKLLQLEDKLSKIRKLRNR